MKYMISLTLVLAFMFHLPAVVAGQEQGVIVLINNRPGQNATFQTPVWVGFHDGNFDIYDRGVAASSLPIPGSDALERLAEDGSTGPISNDFATLVPTGTDATLGSNTPGRPPLAPRDRVTRMFRLDPAQSKYFSYASMVIPSNDAFIANGSPLAHPIFDAQGMFIAQRFNVLGDEVLDAGTEVNDEIPENTAFFGQSQPNTGVDEGGTVVLHPGFLPPAAGGILADPMFANADFLRDGYRTLFFRFQTINIDRANRFNGLLDAGQEIPPPDVNGFPFGFALTRTNRANDRLSYLIFIRGLSGEPTAAHLHVGLTGRTGPVVADLANSGSIFSFQGQTFIFGSLDASNVIGPLANGDAPFDNLIAELATRGIYVNVHTTVNPAGEVRGQLFFGG